MPVGVWAPGWQERFRALVQRLGYDDTFAFVMSRPGESFGQMFGHLRRASGPENASLGMQKFVEMFYVDANNHGKLREAVMEALVRSMRQYLRHGWNVGKRLRERRIDARVEWQTPSFVSHAGWKYNDWKRFRDHIWEQIESMGPPDDWCPMDCKDPLIQESFSRVWPTESPPKLR